MRLILRLRQRQSETEIETETEYERETEAETETAKEIKFISYEQLKFDSFAALTLCYSN